MAGQFLTDDPDFIDLQELAAGAYARAFGLTSDGGVRVGLTGDSITANGSSTMVRDISRIYDLSWFGWANALMGQRFTFVYNAAIGGTLSDTMLANIDTLIAQGIDECWMLIGANDCNSAASGASPSAKFTFFKSNVTATFNKLRAKGITVRIGTIMPTSTTDPYWSPLRVKSANLMNEWIRTLPQQYPGTTVFDFAALVVNPTSSTCQPKANILQGDDGIHPGPRGAFLMGQEVARVVAGLTPELNRLPISSTQFYAYDTPNFLGTWLNSDPMFVTTTGGTNGTSGVITGSVPAGLTLNKSGTWGAGLGTVATASRADGFGNDAVLTVTGTGAAGDYLDLYMGNLQSGSRIVAGDRLVAVASVSCTGLTNFKGFNFRLESTGDTTAYGSFLEPNASAGDPGAVAADYNQADHTLTLMTGVLTVPANPTTLYSRFRPMWFGSGAGTIKIGRWAVFKLPY